jgi:hypothetical protein
MNVFVQFHYFCQIYSATMLRQLSAIIVGALAVNLALGMVNVSAKLITD